MSEDGKFSDIQYRKIADALKRQLDDAFAVHVSAAARFDLIISQSPGGLPHPDGTMRIHQAAKDARTAMGNYVTALKRFSDFTLYKTVPDGWQPPEHGQSVS